MYHVSHADRTGVCRGLLTVDGKSTTPQVRAGPRQQARLGLDEEGNTTNDVATQTTTEKDKLIAPKPDIAPTASTWQRFACAFRARLHELHPHALLGAMFGLFLIAFFVGYCRCCRRSDALSRQYTELQAAGSLEQL